MKFAPFSLLILGYWGDGNANLDKRSNRAHYKDHIDINIAMVTHLWRCFDDCSRRFAFHNGTMELVVNFRNIVHTLSSNNCWFFSNPQLKWAKCESQSNILPFYVFCFLIYVSNRCRNAFKQSTQVLWFQCRLLHEVTSFGIWKVG